MKRTRAIFRALGFPLLLHPIRGGVTWACQHGILPPTVRRYLPWSWELEPFTISGPDWRCRWSPAEFDDVGHLMFWSGLREWERETAPVILEQLRSSRCFIDIGANCGIYTILGCAINPHVQVIAVEPVPKIYAALANNVSLNNFNSRVTVLNVALTDTNGTVPFHEAECATMGSLAVDGYQGQRGIVVNVACRTLDSIVEELGAEPDFLKIDVEGFEHLVLSGGGWVLSNFRPRIVLEANPGDPGEAMTEILLKYGYGFQNITDSGLTSRGAIVPVRRYPNWLCTPEGGASQTRNTYSK